MKNTLLILLVAAALCAGCERAIDKTADTSAELVFEDEFVRVYRIVVNGDAYIVAYHAGVIKETR